MTHPQLILVSGKFTIIVPLIDFKNIMNYTNKNKKGWGDDYKISLEELTPIMRLIK